MKKNVIALIVICRKYLKAHENDMSILGDVFTKVILNNVNTTLEKKIKDKKIESYDEKMLLELALKEITSIDNIKYASKYYIEYINNLTSDAIGVLENSLLIDETFEV